MGSYPCFSFTNQKLYFFVSVSICWFYRSLKKFLTFSINHILCERSPSDIELKQDFFSDLFIVFLTFLMTMESSIQNFTAATSSVDVCLPQNHQLLDEAWRYHDRLSRDVVTSDDTKLVAGWYRFSKSSYRMLERNEMFPDLTNKDRVRLPLVFQVYIWIGG